MRKGFERPAVAFGEAVGSHTSRNLCPDSLGEIAAACSVCVMKSRTNLRIPRTKVSQGGVSKNEARAMGNLVSQQSFGSPAAA